MTLRVILARLTGTASDEAVLDSALALIPNASEGYIRALMVRSDPRLTLPSPVEEGMSPALFDAIFESAERTGTEKARKIGGNVQNWCLTHGVKLRARAREAPSLEFIDMIGLEEDILAGEARLADITVMALPSKGTVDDAVFEVALLESGHPVMLVPPGTQSNVPISNILVAWNDSPEVARAVSAMIPLMRTAAKVTVITVTDGPLNEGVAGRLVNYLAEHRIQAAIEHHDDGNDMSIEDKLLSVARDIQADLLVMGAYTHNRLRELIFGGVTRHLLRHAPIRTIMCH